MESIGLLVKNTSWKVLVIFSREEKRREDEKMGVSI